MKNKQYASIGVDLSLRSTGISVVDKHGNLLDCLQHKTKKTDDEVHEQLLIDNVNVFMKFIRKSIKKYNISEVVIEGLSFGSKSSLVDVIAGHMWRLRIEIFKIKMPIRIVTPGAWRKTNNIKPKNKKLKELKRDLGVNYWKILAVNKLDQQVKSRMEKYVKRKGWNKLKYDKHLWDLADAYWIARA